MSHETVLLRGDPAFQERVAAGTITPGMLIELTSSDEVQANSTAQDPAPVPFFAMEDSLQGREVNVDYVATEIVKFITAQQGDRVKAIAGAAVTLGDIVESAGNGKLITRTTGKGIGLAKEAAAGDDSLFIVEIL